MSGMIHPMDAIWSNVNHEVLGEDHDPIIDPAIRHDNRMVARLAKEEGVIDVNNECATNEIARRCTANLIDNVQRVENFIDSECRANGVLNITSPGLVKKYDYYYEKEYAIEK